MRHAPSTGLSDASHVSSQDGFPSMYCIVSLRIGFGLHCRCLCTWTVCSGRFFSLPAIRSANNRLCNSGPTDKQPICAGPRYMLRLSSGASVDVCRGKAAGCGQPMRHKWCAGRGRRSDWKLAVARVFERGLTVIAAHRPVAATSALTIVSRNTRAGNGRHSSFRWRCLSGRI